MSNCVAQHATPAGAVLGRLCVGHARALTDDLASLAYLYDQLAYVLVRAAQVTEAVSFSRDPGLALDLDAYRARSQITLCLHTWTRIALEEGPWRYPPPDSVRIMAAWLRVRVGWFAASDHAEEVCRDLASTVSDARYALQPERMRRVELGYHCPERLVDQDERDAGPCPGVLVAVIHDLDSLLPSEVICTGRPMHTWGAAQWRALGRRVLRTGYVDLARRVVSTDLDTRPKVRDRR